MFYFLIIIVQYHCTLLSIIVLNVLKECFDKQNGLIFSVCLHTTKVLPRNMLNKRQFVFVRRETYLILPAGQASEELSDSDHQE